jgi:hypothetical protein
VFGGDGKAVLFAQGCYSATQTYLPFFTIQNEDFVKPDFPFTLKQFVQYEARVQKYLQLKMFKQTQRIAFKTEIAALLKKKLSPADLAKEKKKNIHKVASHSSK